MKEIEGLEHAVEVLRRDLQQQGVAGGVGGGGLGGHGVVSGGELHRFPATRIARIRSVIN